MVSVRVVERPVDPVVDMVAVGDLLVAAPWTMVADALHRGAGGRLPTVHVEPVLLDVLPVLRVEMPVVQVVGVVSVPDLGVPATGPMCVRMLPVLLAGHHRPPAPHRLPAIRRRQRMAAVLVAAGLAVASCGGRGAPGGRGDQTRLVGAATIAPLADLVGRVAGPAWTIRTVVPPGSSAHTFEPAPKDVRRLAGARLVVVVGGEYDGWAARLAATASREAVVLDAGAAAGVGRHGKTDVEDDPHWWLSPPLARASLAAITQALSRIDPDGADGYRLRAAETSREIDRLDEEIAARLAPFRGRSFFAAHPAWPHFAARFGLRQAGSIEPAPGREPSPRELRALVDTARAGGVGVLFTEPQFPASAARVVASDGGLSLSLLDPIGGVPGRGSYFEMMRFNAASLEKALGERRDGRG